VHQQPPMDEGINDEVKQEDEKRKMKLTTLQNLISEFRQDARDLTGIQMKRDLNYWNGYVCPEERGTRIPH
jgi:hypothetical protein